MAFRLSRRVGLAALLAVSAAVVPALASATPSPRPSAGAAANRVQAAASVGAQISEVQQRLRTLQRRNSELDEDYNQAAIAYQHREATARWAGARYAKAEQALRVASDAFSSAVAVQYEGGAFSATGALLDSNSGTNYLDQLQTLSMLSEHTAQLVSNYTVTQRQARTAKSHADEALAEATAARQKVAQARVQTTQAIGKYRTLLASLTVKQRAIWIAEATSKQAITNRAEALKLPTGMSLPMSPRIRAAVMFALNQVGKPYVFGSAGPDSWDCSGLTMQAYAAAGVSLPHSAYLQYGYGHHVGFRQLQPGDLMFFYAPISHVTMYIGDGLMVSAPTEGEVVQVISASSFGSEYAGATRLLG